MAGVWKWSSGNEAVDEAPVLESAGDLQLQSPLLLLRRQRLMDSVLVWHKVAAVSGIIAMLLGSYGSHMYQPIDTYYKEVWNTAALYHMVHSAALLAVPLAKRPHVFGFLLTFGIVFFSGTCYMVAYSESKRYAFPAPFGGLGFIAAWASLLF
jgi:uncharacterized membrane protein YgdD (TMEM256/DUF423 family)